MSRHPLIMAKIHTLISALQQSCHLWFSRSLYFEFPNWCLNKIQKILERLSWLPHPRQNSTVCFNLTKQNCDCGLNWSSEEMKNYTQLVNERPWKIMIGLSHYRECGLYDATLMTGKLVSRSKQIDSELSDFRNQLNELMQSFNTVMWPDVRWQSIWHWCKVIWCPQNDPGGNKTCKMAIKVHNKRTTDSIHIIAAYNGEIQGWFDVVYEVQLLYKVLSLCFPWSDFPCSLWYAPKGYFLGHKMSLCVLWHSNDYKLLFFVNFVFVYSWIMLLSPQFFFCGHLVFFSHGSNLTLP